VARFRAALDRIEAGEATPTDLESALFGEGGNSGAVTIGD